MQKMLRDVYTSICNEQRTPRVITLIYVNITCCLLMEKLRCGLGSPGADIHLAVR